MYAPLQKFNRGNVFVIRESKIFMRCLQQSMIS